MLLLFLISFFKRVSNAGLSNMKIKTLFYILSAFLHKTQSKVDAMLLDLDSENVQ